MQDQEEAITASRQSSQPSPDNEPVTSTQSNKQPESIANEEQSEVERQETHGLDNETSREQTPKRRPGPLNEEQRLAVRSRQAKITCTRCRERKIRCSGDLGDGSGCKYCAISGFGETKCRFGVVGSKDVVDLRG